MNNENRYNILIINGVNLACLGTREIDVYGKISFEEHLMSLKERYPNVGFEHFQSDIADEVARKITTSRDIDAIILNAGAFTHTSVIVADAVRATQVPVIEVHISNLFGRENYRRNSVLSGVCAGFISGFGLQSYDLAVESVLMKKKAPDVKLFKI